MQDTACDYAGGYALAKSLEWSGQEAFNAAPLVELPFGGGQTQAADGLTWIQVEGAGHMVSRAQLPSMRPAGRAGGSGADRQSLWLAGADQRGRRRAVRAWHPGVSAVGAGINIERDTSATSSPTSTRRRISSARGSLYARGAQPLSSTQHPITHVQPRASPRPVPPCAGGEPRRPRRAVPRGPSGNMAIRPSRAARRGPSAASRPLLSRSFSPPPAAGDASRAARTHAAPLRRE
eukprot:scaffold349_cov352-Prasinococcus_capsulatus_cf.AAC.2